MSRENARGRQTQSRSSNPRGRFGPARFLRNDPSEDSDSVPQTALQTLHSPPTSHHTSPARSRTMPVPPLSEVVDDYTSDEDDTHFTLRESINPSTFAHLFRLKPKLTATNFSTWAGVVLRALQAVGLHVYLAADFARPRGDTTETRHHPVRWQRANSFVSVVLTTAMTEEMQNEFVHLSTASEIWAEARRLCADSIATDWTHAITSLVTTRYSEGDDVQAHIAKMKAYRRDLALMQRNIDDELFACFLRISMPSTWNYVFAGLPDRYTSAEVERRIRDEYGIRTCQTADSSFRVAQPRKSRSGLSRTPIPGQPYCTNCRISGHWTRDCFSPGGPMYRKRRDRMAEREESLREGDWTE